MKIFDAGPDSSVLVYRQKKNLWEGPFPLVSNDGRKTAIVYTGKRPVPFFIAAVK